MVNGNIGFLDPGEHQDSRGRLRNANIVWTEGTVLGTRGGGLHSGEAVPLSRDRIKGLINPCPVYSCHQYLGDALVNYGGNVIWTPGLLRDDNPRS